MNESLRFYLMTDLHHYASCFDMSPEHHQGDQKCMAETGAVIDAAVDMLLQDTECKIILIDGDVSNNGEHQSHEEVIAKLHRLTDAGKRVFAITATHDYNNAWLNHFSETDDLSVPRPTAREELPELYRDFGLNEAIAYEPESHCYCVRLQPGYRLLCLNDDGNGRSFCGYYNKTKDWIVRQAEEAKKAGDCIFAMTHHPVIPPTPIYPVISERDMIGDYKTTAPWLADLGIKFVFTGHTHMQNIAYIESEKGNRLYDINTGSLVGYPTAIRKCVFDGKTMDVKTVQIRDFDWDRKGMSVNEYLQYRFDRMMNTAFDAAENDIEKFAGIVCGVSVDHETCIKLRGVIHAVGYIANRMTLGTMAKLLLLPCDKSIRNKRLRDFITEVVRNIWGGNEPYVTGTPENKMISVLAKRLAVLAGPFDKDGKIREIIGILPAVIGDEGIDDWNAVLT